MIVAGLKSVVVTCVSAGGTHSLAVTLDGRLFSFGDGAHGQLGHGTGVVSCGPQVVTYFVDGESVRQASAGTSHSLVVTRSGRLYSFGSGGWGKLGHGNTDACFTPRVVESFARPTRTDGGCGGDSDGDGDDGRAAVGLEELQYGSAAAGVMSLASAVQTYRVDSHTGKAGFDMSRRPSPSQARGRRFARRAPRLQIVEASAGFAHSLALTVDGDVYAFGRGADGQLGLGDCNDRSTPALVRDLADKRIVQVSAGAEHSLVLAFAGHVFRWVSVFASADLRSYVSCAACLFLLDRLCVTCWCLPVGECPPLACAPVSAVARTGAWDWDTRRMPLPRGESRASPA